MEHLLGCVSSSSSLSVHANASGITTHLCIHGNRGCWSQHKNAFIKQSFILEKKKKGNFITARSLHGQEEDRDEERSDPPVSRSGINHDALPPLETENISETLKREERIESKFGNSAGKDGSQKSIEDTLGLLKEQMVEDRKKSIERNKEEDDRKLLKRSKVLAKQLISRSSANAIGFISQLWVSAGLFKVVALEVRPSLLSGEADGVLLDDVCQVGDVVLVGDESVLESEMTFRESETLVGYDLVDEDGNYLGKVRDFSFNLHDGKVTSLEFDSLGSSLIPSSLISTYWLDAEEVIEIFSDCIMIRQGAEARIRRLSKGLWQLPTVRQGKTRNIKMIRRRASRRESSESETEESNSRQLPLNRSSSFLGANEFDSLGMESESKDRYQIPVDYSASRYRR